MLNSNDYNNTQIDELYSNVVSILINAENLFVPRHNKTFYKFWWNDELSILKKDLVETNIIWKAAGKPRSGLIFTNRQRSRMQYRKRLRECEQQSTLSYNNDLHEALLHKNGVAFSKCWRAKFESSSKCVEVDNCVGFDVVVNNRIFQQLTPLITLLRRTRSKIIIHLCVLATVDYPLQMNR